MDIIKENQVWKEVPGGYVRLFGSTQIDKLPPASCLAVEPLENIQGCTYKQVGDYILQDNNGDVTSSKIIRRQDFAIKSNSSRLFPQIPAQDLKRVLKVCTAKGAEISVDFKYISGFDKDGALFCKISRDTKRATDDSKAKFTLSKPAASLLAKYSSKVNGFCSGSVMGNYIMSGDDLQDAKVCVETYDFVEHGNPKTKRPITKSVKMLPDNFWDLDGEFPRKLTVAPGISVYIYDARQIQRAKAFLGDSTFSVTLHKGEGVDPALEFSDSNIEVWMACWDGSSVHSMGFDSRPEEQ